MHSSQHPAASTPPEAKSSEPKAVPYIGGTSLLFALLQSVCTAVLTISGIRLAIGLSAFAFSGMVVRFHQDAIRIPMLIVATAGAVLNLAVIAWIRHLRNRPSAQWRRKELTAKEKRSERLQIIFAIITLILVGVETWTHILLHRPGPPPAG